MKTLHFNKGEYQNIEYPIGSNMLNAIEIADGYSRVLIKHLKESYDVSILKLNLWVRGSSGAILGAMVAKDLTQVVGNNVMICHIKKDNENAHRRSPYYHNRDTYVGCLVLDIIVDDFMSTGETIEAIYMGMRHIMCNIKPVIHYMCLVSGYDDNLTFVPEVFVTR